MINASTPMKRLCQNLRDLLAVGSSVTGKELIAEFRLAILRAARGEVKLQSSSRLWSQFLDQSRHAHDRYHSFEVVTQHRQSDLGGYVLESFQQEAIVVHGYFDSPKGMFGERFPPHQHLRMCPHPSLQTIQHFMMHPTFDSPAIFAGGALRSQRATMTLLGGIDAKLFGITCLPAGARHDGEFGSLRTYIHVAAGVIDEFFAREQSAPLGITQLRHRHVGSDLFIFTSFDYFTTKVTAISHYR